MKYRNTVLSKREREEITTFLVDEKNISMNFILTRDEVLRINKLEKHYLRIGYALQYLYLKAKGISIIEMGEQIPQNIVDFIGLQLNCNTTFFSEYWKIKNTKSRHFQKICKTLKYLKFKYNSDLEKEIYKIAFSCGNNMEMVKKFLQLMKDRKVVAPSLQMIEHFLWLVYNHLKSTT